MQSQPKIKLNDGNLIPQLGLGVWQMSNEDAAPIIRKALEIGYRHIDTATIYENEKGVGEGIRSSGLAREDIFVTTKLWNDMQGRDRTLKAFDASLRRLGLDYVDLYLIHWPSPHRGLYLETWKTLVELKNSGRVRSIGVSNFCPEHLERIIGETGVRPVLNQVELHPLFQQVALREVLAELEIAVECWSPLGQGTLLSNPVVNAIAQKHDRSPAQVVIRWHMENGFIVIPKSSNPGRIRENFETFNFSLDEDDMKTIAELDSPGGRIGPDPMTAGF